MSAVSLHRPNAPVSHPRVCQDNGGMVMMMMTMKTMMMVVMMNALVADGMISVIIFDTAIAMPTFEVLLPVCALR